MLWPMTKRDLEFIWAPYSPSFFQCPDDLTFWGCEIRSSLCQKGFLFFALKGNRSHGWEYRKDALERGAYCIVTDSEQCLSDWDQPVCLLSHPESAFQDLARESRRRLRDTCVIAIGGSCGKTTTKEILAYLFENFGWKTLKTQGSENGWLGVPLTLCQSGLKQDEKVDVLIVEIGIDSPNSMSFLVDLVNPHETLLTALGWEHSEHFASLDQIVAEEKKLLRRNIHWKFTDPLIRSLFDTVGTAHSFLFSDSDWDVLSSSQKDFYLSKALVGVFSFSREPSFFRVQIFEKDQAVWLYESEAPFQADYFFEQAALSCLVFQSVTGTHHVPSLGSFSHLGGRFQEKYLGSHFLIDDTYNSNPLSLEKSLKNLENLFSQFSQKVFFLGSMLELGKQSEREHLRVLNFLKPFEKLHVVFVGKPMKICWEAFEKENRQDWTSEWFLICSEISQEVQRLMQLGPVSFFLKGSRAFQLEKLIPLLSNLVR